MRQRVAIAIALLHEPDLIIADEPTTALDVTIQAQILAEVQKLCAETGTALIWITHDLAVVSALADRIAVMYAGPHRRAGPAADVIDAPLHPYTRGLIDSRAEPQRRGEPLRQIPGMAPSHLRPAAGLRLPAALPARRRRLPAAAAGSGARPGHVARCFHPHLARSQAGACPHDAASSTSPASPSASCAQLDAAERIARRLGARLEERTVHAVDGVRSERSRRARCVGPRRRVRLRQVDARPHGRRADDADRRRDPLQGRRRRRPEGRRPRARPPSRCR